MTPRQAKPHSANAAGFIQELRSILKHINGGSDGIQSMRQTTENAYEFLDQRRSYPKRYPLKRVVPSFLLTTKHFSARDDDAGMG